MRVGSILSLIFHLAIVLLLLFGLPDLFAQDEMVIEPVPVQLATVADLTTAPKPADVPKPVVKPADTPPPPAPQAPPTPTPPTPPAPPQTEPTRMDYLPDFFFWFWGCDVWFLSDGMSTTRATWVKPADLIMPITCITRP